MGWIIGIVSFFLFIAFQAQGIVGGDSGDLVVAAVTRGVAHPPGYPLYTFLGWLLHFLPFGSPAWRVGLLSSLPHAITIAIVYETVYILTKKKNASLFAALMLAGNYLFFLYSVTPEVFALFDLFVSLYVFLVVRFIQTGRVRFLYWGTFTVGLSLAHHHAIIFLFPAVAWVLWAKRRGLLLVARKKNTKKRLAFLFFLGLVPYVYIPIAARGSAIVNWDNVVTFTNFFRLVTRADYGTFLSGGFFGPGLVSRLLQLKAYAQLIAVDYRLVGALIIGMGAYGLWKRQRVIGIFLLLAVVFVGPIFLFYASFPLVNRFTLGTYERFLLPSYVLFSLWLGVGYTSVTDIAAYVGRRVLFTKVRNVAVGLLSILLFIYPLTNLTMTLWRFWGLPNDRTGDELGVDILAPLPYESILILARDTSLFVTQYVRYATGFRSDVFVLQLSLLGSKDYQAVILKAFPSIILPQVSDDTFVSEFLKQNVLNHPVFANAQIRISDDWVWVPYGLVYRLYPKDLAPDVPVMAKTNNALWEQFHNPAPGILSRYNHLLLSDIRDVYAIARLDFAKVLLRAGDTQLANVQLENVIALDAESGRSEAYTYLGLTELFANNCQRALEYFDRAQETAFGPTSELSLYKSITYRDCVHDETKAKIFSDEYHRLKNKEETPLDRSR